MLGWGRISWDLLEMAAINFYRHHRNGCCDLSTNFVALHKLYERVGKIQWIRSRYHANFNLDLPTLLHGFRYRTASDNRDKVFALLGLVMRNPEYQHFKADYTLSVETIYRNFFTGLLQQRRSFDLLLRQGETRRNLNLPTWMPDWTAEVEELAFDLFNYVKGSTHLYNCSRSTSMMIRLPHETSSILSVGGLLFDEIVTISDSLQGEEQGVYDAHVEEILNMLLKRSIVGDGRRYRVEDFLRLLHADTVADIVGDGDTATVRRATNDDSAEFVTTYYSTTPWSLGPHVPAFLRAFNLFTTKSGYIGLGPHDMRLGDTVHVFYGGNLPFILRPASFSAPSTAGRPLYTYVGHCLVQGIMDGEALASKEVNEANWIDII